MSLKLNKDNHEDLERAQYDFCQHHCSLCGTVECPGGVSSGCKCSVRFLGWLFSPAPRDFYFLYEHIPTGKRATMKVCGFSSFQEALDDWNRVNPKLVPDCELVKISTDPIVSPMDE